MRTLTILAIVGLMTATASATDWYARGDYNNWDPVDLMDDMGGGYYTKTISGLNPGDRFNYKIALADWSDSAPGSDGRVAADANGEINYHFWENDVWADGWEPAAKKRVGYDDPGMFDWEIAGSMNGWGDGTMLLTDMGGGMHHGEFAMLAGSYDFKFREQGSWDTAIGDDFGNSAANNNITVANDGDIWAFDIDLSNGRWQTSLVPEPASLTLLALGALALVRRR